jgi:hypothetical protein
LRNGLLRAIVSAADTWRIHLVTVEAFMTPLRQRFIEDLQLRNRSPRTVECYVFHLKKFATHFGVSPDRLGAEQVHRYLLHLLHQQKASWSHYNQAVLAESHNPRQVHFCLPMQYRFAVGAKKKLSVGDGGAGVEDARVAPELIVGQQREGRAGVDLRRRRLGG